MTDFIKYTLPFLILTLLFSCVDESFTVDDYDSQIVIDGWIEQDKYCQVLLTLSAPYFSDIDSLSLRNYSLTRAKVTLSTDERSEILTLLPNSAYFPPYIYKGTRIRGEIGKSYKLTVEYNGTTSYAETTIPKPTRLDKIWFNKEEGQDSLGYLYIEFTDNPDQKDYYRTLTKVKGKDPKYIPNYLPNFSDELFSGQKIMLSLYKGNGAINKMDNLYYNLGDTIQLKFTCIDKVSFDFWYSFQKEVANTGNPFASTNAMVKSNITNGLGIWCGYGSSYYQVIAK